MTRNVPYGRTQWLIPFAVQLIPAGLFGLLVPVACSESPRWLIMRGKREKAVKSLTYLRKLPEDHEYVVHEINEITLQVEHDITAVGAGFMAPIKAVFGQWHISRRLLLTSTLFMWQNGTGINAVNVSPSAAAPWMTLTHYAQYYSPTFFKSIGVTGEQAPLLTTGVFGVIKTIGALLWAFWVSRKPQHDQLSDLTLFVVG